MLLNACINFPLHLSCDLTLPGNTLTSDNACCIPRWKSKTALLSEVFLATSEDFVN